MSGALQNIPHMDEDGFNCFKEVLSRSKCYLEYGAGGSTLYASNIAQVASIITVESDKIRVDKVRGAVDTTSASRLFIEYCDIGEVGGWGTPKNKNRMEHFWLYMAMPWHVAESQKVYPDTVLIDGRFSSGVFPL